MATLSEYKNFGEKEVYFKTIKIKTKNEFDGLYNSIATNKTSIWRGANESKFKIYTSLQRYWIENDLSDDLSEILNYIESIYNYSLLWNSNFLQKYYNNYGISWIPLFASLSILRHHGTPTPLLDWTTSAKVGLFFGSFYCQSKPSDSEIENYFSLFEIKAQHPYSKFNIKDEGFETALNSEEITKERLFREIKDNHKTIFKLVDRSPDRLKFYINNNYNITNQNGLFILNLKPKMPLEQAIILTVRENGKYFNNDSDVVDADVSNLKNGFISYEIHKSLKEYSLNKLRQDGINEAYIFPNLKDLANGALVNYLTKT